MTWAKVSDDFSDDCWTLSDKAFRLHVEALVWNGRKLLDCRIPKDNLRRFAKHPEVVDELVGCGWWSEEADVYVIRHHAQYQRTRDAVVKQQAANAANGAKGGRPPREQASQISPETHSVSELPSESETERDRTGLARIRGEPEERNQNQEHARENGNDSLCIKCGVRPADHGFALCSDCENAQASSRARSAS